MTIFKKRVQAALVGVLEEEVRVRLTELLEGLDIRTTDADWSVPAPDLVLALVSPPHVEEVIGRACLRAHGSSVIAVFPSRDRSLESRAIEAGAHAVVELDMPNDELETLIVRVLVQQLQRRTRSN